MFSKMTLNSFYWNCYDRITHDDPFMETFDYIEENIGTDKNKPQILDDTNKS